MRIQLIHIGLRNLIENRCRFMTKIGRISPNGLLKTSQNDRFKFCHQNEISFQVLNLTDKAAIKAKYQLNLTSFYSRIFWINAHKSY